MFIAAGWLLAMGLLGLFFNNLLERQRNPNMQLDTVHNVDGSREVRLQRNRHGHYFLGGAINGVPVEFMLDTGASDVSIPDAVARRVGLQRGLARQYETANGSIEAYATVLESVRLGELELHQVRASINPHVEGETILLGMSVLKHLEFTQRGDNLIIRQNP